MQRPQKRNQRPFLHLWCVVVLPIRALRVTPCWLSFGIQASFAREPSADARVRTGSDDDEDNDDPSGSSDTGSDDGSGDGGLFG
jgi:hypothetical protein